MLHLRTSRWTPKSIQQDQPECQRNLELASEDEFGEWARYSEWTSYEFLILSVSVNPHRIPQHWFEERKAHWPFRDTITRHANILDRYQLAHPFSPLRTPIEFIEWADTFEIFVPPPLIQLVRGFEERQRASGNLSPGGANAPKADAAVATRERESLLKLVIGMAIAGYRYDPKASRGPVTSEIVNDLEKLGIPLDADTVRKYLREARELLPPETE